MKKTYKVWVAKYTDGYMIASSEKSEVNYLVDFLKLPGIRVMSATLTIDTKIKKNSKK